MKASIRQPHTLSKREKKETHAAPKQPHTTQNKHPSHAASSESNLVLQAGHAYRFCRISNTSLISLPSTKENRKTNHQQLPTHIPRPLQTIIPLPCPQRRTMQIRRKVTTRRPNPLIQRRSVRQMSAETHPRCTDRAGAGAKRQEVVYAETGVFVVGGEFLAYIVSCCFLLE